MKKVVFSHYFTKHNKCKFIYNNVHIPDVKENTTIVYYLKTSLKFSPYVTLFGVDDLKLGWAPSQTTLIFGTLHTKHGRIRMIQCT